MRSSSELSITNTVEAYESLYREHNVSFDPTTFQRVNDLDLVEHLHLQTDTPPNKAPQRPVSQPVVARSIASFDVLSRFQRLSLPVIIDRPNSPTFSASSLDSMHSSTHSSLPPLRTDCEQRVFAPDDVAAGTAYRLSYSSPDAIEAVTPIAGAPSLTPLPPDDDFAKDWTEHLQRRFLLKVGNARLPTVAVCGHMCLADDGAYVYVLALRERVPDCDPHWINLCLDLEDLAVLHAGVMLDIVQTVGWIEDL